MTDEEEQEDDNDCESTNGERGTSVEDPGTRNVRHSERGRSPLNILVKIFMSIKH